MGRKKKISIEKAVREEIRFANAIRDKLNALSNAQLKENDFASKSKNYFSEAKKAPHKTSKKSSGLLKEELNILLQSTGCLKPHVIDPATPTPTRIQKLMTRFDFDGMIIKPNENDLSDAYSSAMKQRSDELYKIYGLYEPNKYWPSDYNLDDIPVWQDMKKFDTISTLGKRLRTQMAKQDIPPYILPEMNYFDLMHLALNYLRETKIPPFESARSRNFKMFAACYHEEFSYAMGLLGYKPQYTQKLLQKMRQGTCDDILHFHHNPNIQYCTDNNDISKTSHFSNMVLTFYMPYHRSFHYPNNMDVNKDIVFFGGYGPLLQIKHNIERERQYILRNPIAHRNEFKLIKQALIPDNGKSR